MKVLRILHIPGGAAWGGGESYILTLVRYLPRERFHLEVLCPEEGVLVQNLKRLGIPTYRMNFTPLINPLTILRLTLFLKRHSFDIVQSHGARMNFYTRVAGRIANVPSLISTHHFSLSSYPVASWRKSVYRALDRWSAKFASINLCVPETLAKELREQSGYSPDTIRFIPNGVDTEKMDPAKISGQSIREEFGVDNRFLVVAGGRMNPEKDHATFLKALARVKAVIPDVKALLIGDGPLREELQNLAVSLGLKDTCFFPGFRSDVPEILAAADLFVLSSISEGMPFMVLEALTLEKPVVATGVYGVSEIICHNQEGLLVPVRSPEAMADSIVTLRKDSTQARRLGKAGRKHVQTYHSTKKTIQMWQDLYQQEKHTDG